MADAPGLLEVCARPEDDCLLLRVHLPYWEGLIHVVERVSRVLGTYADHEVGPAVWHADPVLGALAGDLSRTVPGAWNPFEAGVWAILSGGYAGHGQMLAAFVTHLGRPVAGLPGGLTHTFPDPATVTPESPRSGCSRPTRPRSRPWPTRSRRADKQRQSRTDGVRGWHSPQRT